MEAKLEVKTPIKGELTPASDETLLACMGTTACQRICEYYTEDLNCQPLEGANAFGMERDCPVLGDPLTHALTPDAVTELLEATQLPQVSFLSPEEVGTEIKQYFDILDSQQKAFDGYIEVLLTGSSRPRHEIAAKRQAYEAVAMHKSIVLAGKESITDEERAELNVTEALTLGFHDWQAMKRTGLLFDRSVQTVLIEAARQMGAGNHVQLSGEPGVAKTNLAAYLARINTAVAKKIAVDDPEAAPVIVNLSSTSEAEEKVSQSTFEDNTLGKQLGEIAQAMRDGRGVVLDEANAMTPDQAIFFNDLYLKKPGDTVIIAGQPIVIAKGFSVTATLNPMTDTQGNRRHGRQQLDSAGAARFSRIDMKYPGEAGYNGNGAGGSSDSSKETLNRLFFATWANAYGWRMPSADVIKLVTDASQYLAELAEMATSPPKDGTSANALTGSQGIPLISQCISPRDYVGRILEPLMIEHPSNEIAEAVRKALEIRTEQILHSNNGHLVSSMAISAVKEKLRQTMREGGSRA